MAIPGTSKSKLSYSNILMGELESVMCVFPFLKFNMHKYIYINTN